MPVSTYVPTRGAGTRSPIVDGWNRPSSRSRPDAATHALSPLSISSTPIAEAGLYDRPDWPLPSLMDGSERSGSKSDESPEDARIPRSSRPIPPIPQGDGTAHMGEPDVSDIDEVSEEEDEEDTRNKARRQEQDEEDDDGSDDGESIHMGMATLARRTSCRYSLRRPESHVGTPREANHVTVSSWSYHSSPTTTEHSVSPLRGNTPELAKQPSVRSKATEQDYRVRRLDGEEQRDEQQIRDHARSVQADPESPIPETASISIQSTQTTIGNASLQVQTHGTLDSTNNSAISQWRMSIHNPQSTTHVPHNRERHRYSWQSLQDDEPNRPRILIIKLISTIATASAGFPQGEAFAFSISPKGRRIAAYNSARLFVLQTAALPMDISQDYTLKRRPLAIELTDEGRVMAILADDHTVNVYELGPQRMRLMRTVTLDFPTACIALAPTGGLLAASYEGGVEIFSLDPTALSTDRRAVRAIRMDRMMFSEDGSTLLGTTTRINAASTMVVSVPIFPSSADGIPTSEELKEAWCAELLHPENIRHSSHATFLRENKCASNDRLFSWNALEDTFGVLNVSGMQYEDVDFPVVIDPPLSTCGGLGAAIHSCPTVDEHGSTIAMIVNDRTVRLYTIPRKDGEEETSAEAHSIDHELDEGYGCPFNEARWVHGASNLAVSSDPTSVKGRLIVTSPGGVTEPGLPEECVEDVEGGRIILFDFDSEFAGKPGQTYTLSLGKGQPQDLEEAQVDVEQAVALVRRRTVNQKKNTSLSQRPVTLGRSATTAGNNRSSRTEGPVLRPNPSRMSMLTLHTDASRSLPDLLDGNDQIPAVDEPYAQNAPRSQELLQRAATNAQRHRYQSLEERTQEDVGAEFVNGFLTLPEYTEEPNAPLPSRFRVMAGLDLPTRFIPSRPAIGTDAGESTRRTHTSPGPRTAPADIGEHFSADEAFRLANSRYSAVTDTTQLPSTDFPWRSQPDRPSRSYRNTVQTNLPRSGRLSAQDFAFAREMSHERLARQAEAEAVREQEIAATVATHDFQSMPRGLQRAYSSAGYNEVPRPQSVASTGPRFNLANPNSIPEGVLLPNGTISSPLAATTSSVPEDGAWNPPSTPSADRPTSEDAEQHPPGTAISMAPSWQSVSSASPRGATSSAPPYTPRRVAANPTVFPPPPILADDDNNNNNNNDSVPPTLASDGHRITAWHPPAPSVSNLQVPRRSLSVKSHSRKSSRTNRGAFASTSKAKRLGFFRKGKSARVDPYGRPMMRADGNASVMLETKSVMTWRTGRTGRTGRLRGDKACVVM